MTIHQPIDAVQRYLSNSHRLLINGEWVEAVSGKRFDVYDPARGAVITTVAHGEAADVDRAVKAARASFEGGVWRRLAADDRARIIWRYAELIDEHAQEIAHLDIVNNGMTTAFATGMVGAMAGWLRYFAGEVGKILGRDASGAMSDRSVEFHAYTRRDPIGVVGLILAWNGPAGGLIAKLAPALAAGCSVVAKPAENTPLSALRLGELALEAGIPAGVVNIVSGFGDAGQALAEHPGVDKISFTGSTAVGKQIVRTAAGNLKRVTLELGGKSPCVVFDDADIERAIPLVANGIFMNTGQICSAGSRLFVQRKSFDRVVAGIADIARSLKIGCGFDPTVQIGPLISEKQRRRVTDYVQLGRDAGAEIVSGGASIDGAGYFVEPTIFANVDASMRIVREEIFGPVLVATPIDDLDDFIRYANDTRYGLASGVFTSDINTAHRAAARLEAGNVWVNCYGVNHPTMPFGGYKESGWGRELGAEGLDAFLETKSVFVQLY